MFNYKNSDDFEKFVQKTDENEDLKHCFDDVTEDLEKSSKIWLKILNNTIKTSFTKIRIKKTQLEPKLERLFLEKENLKSRIALRENLEEFDEASELTDELAIVNDKISAFCAEKNRNIVNEYLKDKNDTVEGFNQAKTWSMTKKLYS